jgi:hypothetical protein
MPKQTGGGNAPIIRQGHTTNGQFGSDPNKKAKGRQPVRELKP